MPGQDGNLVVRAANDKQTFYTATGKNRGALLAVQNDGNVWATTVPARSTRTTGR